MDVESEISEVKPTQNDTINTINPINTINSNSNYVYKKAIIKDNYESMINELRTLDFENIANNRMNHMNFNFIINSIINLKKITNSKNPFMKYIKYVKPYNTNINYSKVNIKGNKNKNKILSEEEKKHLKVKQKFPKLSEKTINFQKNSKNFYFTRMCNSETKRINSSITEKIIMLQKNIRGFLSKKVIDEYINNEIAKTLINSILLIQRAVRKFLLKKKSLDKLLIKIVKNERYTKGNKITDIFSKYHFRNVYKKFLIIKKIVIARYRNASLIQSTFKSFILQRKVKKIIKKEKKSYILTYPFSAESVKLKIYMGDELYTYKIFNYFICPIRKYFITYIEKKILEPGEYLCHIIVDDNIKIDKRYKFIDRDNILYNLIPFGSHLKKRRKSKQVDVEMEKRKKKLIKKQKERDKKINDELDNFYIYYYNNNGINNNNNNNSVNSVSTNSDQQEKNKLNYRNQIDEDDPDQVIDISDQFYKSKLNHFLLKTTNYKYIKMNYDENKDKEGKNKKKPEKNKKDKIPKPNMKNKNKNKSTDKNLNELNDKNIFQYKFDSIKSRDDNDNDSIFSQSQNLNYNNILDELSQSAKSVVSNITVPNIHSYSKRTHEAKFTDDIINSNGNKKLMKIKSYNGKKNSIHKTSSTNSTNSKKSKSKNKKENK